MEVLIGQGGGMIWRYVGRGGLNENISNVQYLWPKASLAFAHMPNFKVKFGPEFAFGQQKQVQFLGPFKTQIPPLSVSKQGRPTYYRVTPNVRGIFKIKGLEQGSIVEFSTAFWECPPFAGSIAKNKPKAIIT